MNPELPASNSMPYYAEFGKYPHRGKCECDPTQAREPVNAKYHDDTGPPERETREERRRYSGCEWFHRHGSSPPQVQRLIPLLERRARQAHVDPHEVVSRTLEKVERALKKKGNERHSQGYFFKTLNRQVKRPTRRNKPIPHSPDDLNDMLVDEQFSSSIIEDIDWQTGRHPLARELQLLNERQRQIVQDLIDDELTAMSAARNEMTENALFSARSRIRTRLRQALIRAGYTFPVRK